MNKKILNVFYQSDNNYAAVSGMSIVSLLTNNKHLDLINIYYCGYHLKDENKNKLNKIISQHDNATIQFIDGKGYHDEFKKIGVKPWHSLYVTWFKLLALADLPEHTEKVLYLNPHTIINGPLNELVDMDLEDYVMGLAYDCLINNHKRTIGLSPADGYYNCGVMLINHKKWLEDNIDNEIREHLQKKSDYVIADQDLCNILFKGRIKLLNSTYNYSSAYYGYDLKLLLKVNQLVPESYYSYGELMGNYYDPKIIHSLFGVKGKPWERGNEHPNRWLWKKYLDMTPWQDSDLPRSKKTLVWRLYDILPKAIFMKMYAYQVNKKFG